MRSREESSKQAGSKRRQDVRESVERVQSEICPRQYAGKSMLQSVAIMLVAGFLASIGVVNVTVDWRVSALISLPFFLFAGRGLFCDVKKRALRLSCRAAFAVFEAIAVFVLIYWMQGGFSGIII